MSFLTEADKQKAELEAKFPGWQIWFSPHHDREITWCAKPHPLINAASPEELAAEIERYEAAGVAGARQEQ